MTTRFCRLFLAGAICLGLQAAGAEASDTSRYPRVRVDLRAGALLDPLPFDEPFLLTGEAPAGTRAVAARFEEYLGVFPSGDEPAALERIREQSRAFLDSVLVGRGTTRVPDLRWLQGRLLRIVAEEVRVPRQGVGGRIFSNLAPWNWGDWGLLFRSGVTEIVAPGTILDPDRFAGFGRMQLLERVTALVRGSVGFEREQDLDAIVDAVTDAARSAQVGVRSKRADVYAPVRWSRLKGPERLDANGESTGLLPRWNRLETLDSELEEGVVSYQFLVPPLNADRTYVVHFRFDRALTEWETNAFRSTVASRLAASTARTEASATQDERTRRLRTDLQERLDHAAGGGQVAVEGTALDAAPSFDEVRGYFRELMDRAGTPEGAKEAAAELASMIRGRRVTSRATATASTSANDYVGADVGVLYAPTISKSAFYVGANFYLRPVNKSVPLSRRGGFGRRFSFTFGLTVQGVDDDLETRRNLYRSHSLIMGTGYRLSQYIRAGAGFVLFRERDPETFPLSNDTQLAVTPYVSLSFDADIGHQLKGLGGIFDFLKDSDDDS